MIYGIAGEVVVSNSVDIETRTGMLEHCDCYWLGRVSSARTRRHMEGCLFCFRYFHDTSKCNCDDRDVLTTGGLASDM